MRSIRLARPETLKSRRPIIPGCRSVAQPFRHMPWSARAGREDMEAATREPRQHRHARNGFGRSEATLGLSA